MKSDGHNSVIIGWVLYTACTYSIQPNQNTTRTNEADYIHKCLPMVWLIAKSENADAVKHLFRFIKTQLQNLCSAHNNVRDQIVIKFHTADNCAAIQAAVSHVYPGCTQGNCVVHAKMNLGKKSKLLGESSDEGKLVNKYRFQAPECPSQLCFLCVSRCLLSFLRRSSNPNASSVAKGIEEYYVNEQKCNWYHVSSGMVSANAKQFN